TNYAELNSTMQVLQKTLKDMQPLLLQLNTRPNSLIFVEGNDAKFEPKGISNRPVKGNN
ncbi:MAG: paraquat-inducible protein B, partial [Paraglaciecola sp.]